MDYLDIYTSAFSNNKYSSDHNPQYDWVIDKLKSKFIQSDIFTIIDIGSGRGHLLKLIHKYFPNAIITSVDLKNFHNLEFVKDFQICNITSTADRDTLLRNKYDVLINLDFLEHIEEIYIDDIIETFNKLSPYCIIAVANHSDIFDGIQLHLIQNDSKWWRSKLEKVFNISYFKENEQKTLYFYEVNRL
jgi:2-polyprenyl-3-methyl-5-hydroxy-6-metoxy-1,4-benzoquinol methylase